MGSELQVRNQAAELGRFVVVGVSAVTVDFGVYFALITLIPLFPTAFAKAVSFVAGALLSFMLNRGFVFRAEGQAKQQLGPFALLYIASLLLNNGVNAVLLGWGASKLIAWFFATGASTMSNFLGMKLVVFRRARNSRKA